MGGKATKEYHRRYRVSHPEVHREANRRYRQKHNTPEDKAKRAEWARNWRLKNLEKSRGWALNYARTHKLEIKLRMRATHQELKKFILQHYGNGDIACVICGENRIDCLSIDHINNNGYEHRRETGNGVHFYNWLKKNNLPIGYQTLCMNCQFLKKHKQ